MALVHTEEAVVWMEEAMEDLVAVVVQVMEESVDSVREEKTDMKVVDLEAAEVCQALVVQAAVVLQEEPSAPVEGLEVVQLKAVV